MSIENRAPRIALHGRPASSLATTPGGDQVQIREIVQILREEHGFDAVATEGAAFDPVDFDLVHLFGSVRPQDHWTIARRAHRQGVPILLSTVFCDVWEFETMARPGLLGTIARLTNRDVVEGLKALARGVRSREWSVGTLMMCIRGYSRMQHDVATWATAYSPNSDSEWVRYSHELGLDLPLDRVHVVTNAVDASSTLTEEVRRDLASAMPHLSGCILCVGRIEGRKNQLALLEACLDLGRPIVFAGPPAANQPAYVRAFEKRVNEVENATWLGAVDTQTKVWLYEQAAVHALPSWMETTGLSTLEAQLHGCNVVVSPNGDTREYFGDSAQYCDPSDHESIVRAVTKAMSEPVDTARAEHVRQNLNWRRAAAQTATAYRTVLTRG